MQRQYAYGCVAVGAPPTVAYTLTNIVAMVMALTIGAGICCKLSKHKHYQTYSKHGLNCHGPGVGGCVGHRRGCDSDGANAGGRGSLVVTATETMLVAVEVAVATEMALPLAAASGAVTAAVEPTPVL